MGNNTTVVGAGFGAALGAIVVYLAEILTDTDIPTGVEGAILVVVATLAAYLIPPSRGANGRNPS